MSEEFVCRIIRQAVHFSLTGVTFVPVRLQKGQGPMLTEKSTDLLISYKKSCCESTQEQLASTKGYRYQMQTAKTLASGIASLAHLLAILLKAGVPDNVGLATLLHVYSMIDDDYVSRRSAQ